MNYIALDASGKILGLFISNELDYAANLQAANPHFASVHETSYQGDLAGKLYDPVTDTVSDDPDYVPPPPPEPPLPTLEDYDRALTAHLDAVAQSRRWQDRIRLMARAGFPGPWQADAIAFGQWADTCNSIGYAILADFQAGTIPQPAIAEVIAALPEMVWPT
jgi:hypothetical protein